MVVNTLSKNREPWSSLGPTGLTDVEVEVLAEMHRVGILVQEPTVGCLEETVGTIVRDLELDSNDEALTSRCCSGHGTYSSACE